MCCLGRPTIAVGDNFYNSTVLLNNFNHDDH